METLTERELDLTDLILQQLEEDLESNTDKLAAFEELEHLNETEKKERYWQLFRLISRQLDTGYVHKKRSISIKLNPAMTETVRELRKNGGIRTIQETEQTRISKLKDYLFGSH